MKFPGGRGLFNMNMACRKVDFSFEGCREEHGQERRLAALLDKIHRWLTKSTAVVKILLCLPEELIQFYFVAKCAY